MNSGAGGDFVWIFYLLGFEDEFDEAPITSIKTRNADWNQSKPEGYTQINVDLNKGAGGDWIYLLYKRRAEESEDIITGLKIYDEYWVSSLFGGEWKSTTIYSSGTDNNFTWLPVNFSDNPSSSMDLNAGCGAKTDTILLYFTRDIL